jgi:hypothetical protein
MRTRVNGANGNLDVGAISGTAASDYAHSDALSAGDLINLVATLPGGATTWSAHTWAVLLEAADPDATITAEVMTATARMIDAVFMGGIVPFLTDLEGDYVLVDELEGDWA